MKQHGPEPKNQTTETVIRFSMKDDEILRTSARRGYQVAKHFKLAGLKVKGIFPAASNPSAIKVFKLPINTDLLCLDIDISKKNDNDIAIMIEDTKNNFLLIDNFKLIAEHKFSIEAGRSVYRFLFKYDDPNKQ